MIIIFILIIHKSILNLVGTGTVRPGIAARILNRIIFSTSVRRKGRCHNVQLPGSKKIYPPIITVKLPNVIEPPCAVVSPILAAGIPPIITVPEPFTMLSGGPAQVSISPILAAGCPSMSTVGQPGGITGPPTCGEPFGLAIGHVCISPTLAAPAISV